MAELRVGQKVLVWNEGGLAYEPVLYFLHHSKAPAMPFIQVEMESGAELQLTENHLVYATRGDCSLPTSQNYTEAEVTVRGRVADFRLASRLLEPERGEDWCLSRVHEGVILRDRVLRAQSIRADGLYAPVTPSGTVVVNGLVASCYANFPSQSFAHLITGMAHSIVGLDAQMGSEEGWKAPTAVRFLGNLGLLALHKTTA